MQINLKQSEIEVALKNYIAQQGINLSGKDVAISFTAGRKEAGISADISIEDIEIPFYEAEAEANPTPVPQLVAYRKAEESQPSADSEEEVAQTVEQEEAPQPAKTTSLFG